MNNRYIKTVEKEVEALLGAKPNRTSGKGLLSPKKTDMPKQAENKTSKDFVVSLVSDIRRKRLMMKEGK